VRRMRVGSPGQGADKMEPESTPTFKIDRVIAEARREMGEARWQELMKEWTDA